MAFWCYSEMFQIIKHILRKVTGVKTYVLKVFFFQRRKGPFKIKVNGKVTAPNIMKGCSILTISISIKLYWEMALSILDQCEVIWTRSSRQRIFKHCYCISIKLMSRSWLGHTQICIYLLSLFLIIQMQTCTCAFHDWTQSGGRTFSFPSGFSARHQINCAIN